MTSFLWCNGYLSFSNKISQTWHAYSLIIKILRHCKRSTILIDTYLFLSKILIKIVHQSIQVKNISLIEYWIIWNAIRGYHHHHHHLASMIAYFCQLYSNELFQVFSSFFFINFSSKEEYRWLTVHWNISLDLSRFKWSVQELHTHFSKCHAEQHSLIKKQRRKKKIFFPVVLNQTKCSTSLRNWIHKH